MNHSVHMAPKLDGDSTASSSTASPFHSSNNPGTAPPPDSTSTNSFPTSSLSPLNNTPPNPTVPNPGQSTGGNAPPASTPLAWGEHMHWEFTSVREIFHLRAQITESRDLCFCDFGQFLDLKSSHINDTGSCVEDTPVTTPKATWTSPIKSNISCNNWNVGHCTAGPGSCSRLHICNACEQPGHRSSNCPHMPNKAPSLSAMAPAPQTLSMYAVFMSSHINPCSINNYLSGITSELEVHYPEVCQAQNSSLVTRTMAGCLHQWGSPVNRKLPLTHEQLDIIINSLSTSTSHDDFLFKAMIWSVLRASSKPGVGRVARFKVVMKQETS
ncbi:hypothetical protein D9758_014630 [Tetrapyrgos nigripes]|uniref:CCHC-type domain-containing protein n=1 Tax=Tetrapyrgos nigripes TaxID=182062 RepID=A0A8H5CYM2_9AGAR|nr:hypothetical protein D9758_014630 [Tetrapyrgos nigripes]